MDWGNCFLMVCCVVVLWCGVLGGDYGATSHVLCKMSAVYACMVVHVCICATILEGGRLCPLLLLPWHTKNAALRPADNRSVHPRGVMPCRLLPTLPHATLDRLITRNQRT